MLPGRVRSDRMTPNSWNAKLTKQFCYHTPRCCAVLLLLCLLPARMWAPGAAAAAARIGVCMVASAVVGGVVVSGSAGTPTRLLPRDGSTATAFTWLLPRVRWPGTSTEGGGDHAPKARKQMRSHRGAAGQGVASSRRLCVLAASPAPSQANVPDTAPASPAATNTSRVSGAQKRVLLIIGGITASFAVIAAPFLIVPWLPKRVFGGTFVSRVCVHRDVVRAHAWLGLAWLGLAWHVWFDSV